MEDSVDLFNDIEMRFFTEAVVRVVARFGAIFFVGSAPERFSTMNTFHDEVVLALAGAAGGISKISTFNG